MENYCLERRGTYGSPSLGYNERGIFTNLVANLVTITTLVANLVAITNLVVNLVTITTFISATNKNVVKLVKTMEPSFFYIQCMM